MSSSLSTSTSSNKNMMSLKSAQLAAIYRMLAFNEEQLSYDELNDDNDGNGGGYLPPAGSSHNQWKIFIYDAHSRSIISPLLSVQQLRRRGVTLHLLLNSEREPIPDVPAVYFVRPTPENLALIAQDCARGLYGRAHVNFVTKLDRRDMEDFAKLVVQSGSLQTIASLHDQYLDYVCLERGLFSLHIPESYVTYNRRDATEQKMEQAMTAVAYGLFSVVATLGQIPVIRCPRGGAPEMVARKLNRMIMEHPTLLRNKSSGTGGIGSHHHGGTTRPLLVILDRNADLITPVQHCSTYQALIDDLLQHAANRVEFQVSDDDDKDNKSKKKSAKPAAKKRYDLDPDADMFYAAQKFRPFPEAIESNGKELQDVTDRESEIRSKTGSSSGPAIVDPMAVAGANALATAVDSLPALLDRKKQLEVHTSILQAVMNQVASRDVPQFYELESGLAVGSYKSDVDSAKKQVLALVGASDKGNLYDKIRLCTVYALTTGAKVAELDELSAALERVGGELQNEEGMTRTEKQDIQSQLDVCLHTIAYLKQLRSMHMIPAATDMMQAEFQQDKQTADSSSASSPGPSSGGGGGSSMLQSLIGTATRGATNVLTQAANKVTSILGKIHKHHATAVVENLCDAVPGNAEDETYLYLDPKVRGDVDVAKLRAAAVRTAPVSSVICFVIGGGCYGEYQNLQLVATPQRQVSYGSTELLDPTSFLTQLGALGKAAASASSAAGGGSGGE